MKNNNEALVSGIYFDPLFEKVRERRKPKMKIKEKRELALERSIVKMPPDERNSVRF